MKRHQAAEIYLKYKAVRGSWSGAPEMRTGEQVGAPRMYKFSIKHCLVFFSGHPLKYPWFQPSEEEKTIHICFK